MKNQNKLPAQFTAEIVFLKPKRLLPPKDGKEFTCKARMLAETVHEYFCEYRANHLRSHSRLLRRIAAVNLSVPTGGRMTGPTRSEFLSAIRKEKYGRAKFEAWRASLTPEIVEQSILWLNERQPGRVVKRRL